MKKLQEEICRIPLIFYESFPSPQIGVYRAVWNNIGIINVGRGHALAARLPLWGALLSPPGWFSLTALIIATGRQRHAFALQRLSPINPNLSA